MNDIDTYKDILRRIRGKTIAVIYIFEGENASGYTHYDIWRGDLIGEWIQAIHELYCLPLIFDARTFTQKAMDRTLPVIDYVINLNNGTSDVNTLGLIPSVCSFLAIPCIPSNTTTSLVGEHKLLSNIIAAGKALHVPAEIDRNRNDGIVRPLSYGSSIGISKGIPTESAFSKEETLYQEFIPGFDMTTPILYNPLTDTMEVLPPVAYIPQNNNTEWFLGEDEKRKHSGYNKVAVAIDDLTKEHYLSMARALAVTTYCRIDARVKCVNAMELQETSKNIIPFDKVYFLEINPLPTIKRGINFHTSLENTSENNPILACKNCYYQEVEQPSLTGFILSCALASLTKAKYGRSLDSAHNGL